MVLKINITKEIIEKSKYCGTLLCSKKTIVDSCAIALAIIDIFPDAVVSTNTIYFNRNMTIFTDLPIEAKNFISKFDKSSPKERINLDEISFKINIPNEIIDSIKIDDLKNSNLELIQ